ncbi:MAG: hypothetical protein NTX73_01515 [Rhodobacterales bacterium]|nr:hypothetical protein [Rhodobacterales bacterium]
MTLAQPWVDVSPATATVSAGEFGLTGQHILVLDHLVEIEPPAG